MNQGIMDAMVCATVTGATTAELRSKRDAAVDADLVELRLDYAEEVDVQGVLSGRSCPVVVTCRAAWEGGRFRGSEEERHRILSQALSLGADYVDVEWRAGFDDLVAFDHGRHVVLSAHDFNQIPTDLGDQLRAMRSTGVAVVKIAATTRRLADLITLRDVGSTGPKQQRLVVVGMGPAGTVTRLVPDRFHSCWTYAGAQTAPGQIELSRMLGEFRCRSTSATSELFGILGAPIEHSLSPAMHNAGFAEIGRDAVYLPFEAADVDDFETFARAFGVRGASVTAPFKEAVLPKLHTVDELGRRIGAVNTLRMESDGWSGINTDAFGCVTPLKRRISLSRCRAAVIGAGGAARGVAVALADEGAEITVHARNPEKARAVAALVDGHAAGLPPDAGTWDLLVNTTPVGTYPAIHESPLPSAHFDGRLVYDLVYNPSVTRLMADAAAAGCPTVGGLEMLVAQAERQFAWWTGVAPGPGTFRAAAERRLADSESGDETDRERSERSDSSGDGLTDDDKHDL